MPGLSYAGVNRRIVVFTCPDFYSLDAVGQTRIGAPATSGQGTIR